jgi:DNA-binding NarL/FixJ family response regulator
MNRPNRIRLLLVDDHSVVRMGLAAILGLEPDLELVGEAEDGAQAIAQYRLKPVDVVLMDVRMPGMDGVTALQRMRNEWPDIRILMLTTSELDEDLQQVIDSGAAGYLLKSAARGEIIAAIRAVHAGQRYLSAGMAQRLAHLEKLKHLTQREVEVLDGMRRGLSNRDISLVLHISEHTVKAHVKAILGKLESADRAEAVARGFETGLLRIDKR